MIDCVAELIPGLPELCIKFHPGFGERIILTRRPAGRFLPPVSEKASIFQPGEQGIQRALQHHQPRFFQLFKYIAGVCLLLALDNAKYAKLQQPFSHLRFCILYSHSPDFWYKCMHNCNTMQCIVPFYGKYFVKYSSD